MVTGDIKLHIDGQDNLSNSSQTCKHLSIAELLLSLSRIFVFRLNHDASQTQSALLCIIQP